MPDFPYGKREDPPVILGPDGRPIALPHARPFRAEAEPAEPLPADPPAASWRERIEKWLQQLEAVGLGVHGAGFFLVWWRKLGLRWAIALFLMFFIPLSEYSILSLAMKRGVPYMLGDFGVRFEAESWDLDLLGLRGTAHKVRLARDEHSPPVFTADQVEFDATLGGLLGRFSTGGTQHFDAITIRDADIHFEQSATGDWNWADFLDSVPTDRRQAVARGQYQTDALRFERVRIEYLEQIPANSGGGVIQTTQARIYADDVTGEVLDLLVPASDGDLPTRFNWKGRSADGIVQVSGRGALFAPIDSPDSIARLNIKVYLENIGMGAYGRMVSTTSILPARGTLRGTIEIIRTSGGTECRSTLVAEDVQLAPNPKIVLARAQYDQLAADLREYRSSGPFNPCGKPGEQERTATGVLASFNTQATTSAPATVRFAVANDARSFGRALSQLTAADASTFVQTQTSRVIEQKGTNAVAKGVRSVGKGFKKLFGR